MNGALFTRWKARATAAYAIAVTELTTALGSPSQHGGRLRLDLL